MSIKKILVPTDFSECAANATEIALVLARKINAELILVHFFPDPGHHVRKGIRDLNIFSPELSVVKAKLHQVVKNAEDTGVQAKGVLVHDKGNDSIEEYAESYGADLIVMGTHGARGLIEWVGGGSNAQKVSRNSNIPVLVLKSCCEPLDVKNILFASSFDEDVLPAMRFIADIASLWNSTIHLLCVNLAIHSVERTIVEMKMNALAEEFPDMDFTINFSESNNEELAITVVAARLNADLITLTPRDRDGVIHFLSHSIAENLVNHEQRPVLVVPENE
jgi:nucleotide-binding universal stress UspA family protein